MQIDGISKLHGRRLNDDTTLSDVCRSRLCCSYPTTLCRRPQKRVLDLHIDLWLEDFVPQNVLPCITDSIAATIMLMALCA